MEQAVRPSSGQAIRALVAAAARTHGAAHVTARGACKGALLVSWGVFCERCGQSNSEGARFCRSCGAEISNPALDLTQSPVPPPGTHGRTMAAPAAAPPPGVSPQLSRVMRAFSAKYAVERMIGQGGMGSVYLAREIALDRPVAIKVLPESQAADDAAVERFLREARVAAQLRHPNVIVIHTVGELDGLYYFTMDRIVGPTLAEKVKDAPAGLPLPEALGLFDQVCRAVEHAHKHGVVHRDLKPSNVMVDESGHVVVLDFGLAKPQGAGAVDLTGTGGIIGTPQYMSPEQVDGKPAGPEADVYSLGLLLFLLASGKDLVTGDSPIAVMMQHASGDHRGRVEAEAQLPVWLRALVLAMVALRAAERPSLVGVRKTLREASLAPAPSPPAPAPIAPATPVVPATPRPAAPKARSRMAGLLDDLDKKKR